MESGSDRERGPPTDSDWHLATSSLAGGTVPPSRDWAETEGVRGGGCTGPTSSLPCGSALNQVSLKSLSGEWVFKNWSYIVLVIESDQKLELI